jgi:hypothetical protein
MRSGKDHTLEGKMALTGVGANEGFLCQDEKCGI